MLKTAYTDNKIEAGCDEAGRGCLAGPVVAAAVIWPRELQHLELNDSKKLSHAKRELLEIEIKDMAIAYAIAVVDNFEIDKINILNASFLAMKKAVNLLTVKPEHLLIDGNRFSGHPEISHSCIIKGDGKFLSIAAASILAKNHRDRLMTQYAETYSNYGWEKNFGYATAIHRDGIIKFGITDLHRKSFLSSFSQLNLFENQLKNGKIS